MDKKELETAVRYLNDTVSDLTDVLDSISIIDMKVSKLWGSCRDISELIKTSKSIIEWELNKIT